MSPTAEHVFGSCQRKASVADSQIILKLTFHCPKGYSGTFIYRTHADKAEEARGDWYAGGLGKTHVVQRVGNKSYRDSDSAIPVKCLESHDSGHVRRASSK